ncbi:MULTISPECIES: carbohydrate ABC transporter permease [Streptomyces]|uniref:carbohydrate ABC transporter permease n=1 Tax=Streptomyces TaxID=1883 RepID=UPI001884C2F7|nr:MULTISPECIES: carbohydrate ABC transporter permease [Streptomyces]MBF8173189.1 carbohydrate ABC transporter permease [Streptomyces olivaceus]MBZ6134980.1 carbohydrate ABC transporter permease [Streptomyces olivaceus]MBZ6141408.1 carbohydrate ABC transporter permease [Streptomyces olivaceus]MBZ6169172.1 carbohydrate ABC transporter permease [Streptomyces olivaceus]MBZ6176207.1 carbohydrate ABC transporter permease [Streptomyces olivaceus]
MKKTLTSAATVRVAFVSLVSLGMLVPMYLLVVNTFKSQQEILANPFTLDFGTATLQYLADAWNNPDFSILKGYGVTIALVLCVNAIAMAVCAPAAYVLARTPRLVARLLLFFFIAGMFIPTQVILVPVIFVLRSIGLMGTLPGLILFMTATTIPFTLFVFFGYIRVLPRSLDEAAAIDGAGRYYTLWRIILPLMRPIVATVFILNSLSVWNDFASPQMILGPGSGIYTVTTGVYAAVGQYSTDYTKVFPTLLLAVIPILVIFIVMQRHIMSGLAAGAVKG